MGLVNFLLKKHAVMLIGNACAPGLFFPKVNLAKGWEQFQFIPKQDCGTVVINVKDKVEHAKDALIFPAEPFMQLDLMPEWNNFEDYLGAMQSKYRVRTKKALSQSAHLEVNQYSGTQITDELLDTCQMLLRDTLRNKTIALNQDLKRILQNFRDFGNQNYHLNTYLQNGKIVGFITWLKSDNTMYAMQVGYEANIAKETHIYQRMLYDLIAKSIEIKLQFVNFGRTATEIKSTLGAKPIDNSYLIYVQNPILKFLANLYKKYFFKPESYVLRNPFKD